MNLTAPEKIYACVVPAGMSDWTEIRAGARKGYEFNGYKSQEYIRADTVSKALGYYVDQFCEGWCDQDAGCAHFEDCSGCLARRTLGGIPTRTAADRVIAELMDRRLLNDVDDDLWPEIADDLIKAVQG